MTYDTERNLYISDVKVGPGDEVGLHTTFMDKTITASDIMPHSVSIEDVTVSRQGPVSIYTNSDFVFTYRVTLPIQLGMETTISCNGTQWIPART